MTPIDEVEVYVTTDGLGRAAIARRNDGFFCIYLHWSFPADTVQALGWDARGFTNWIDDRTPISELYRDKDPESGIYGTVDDARRQIRSLPGFSEANRRPDVTVHRADDADGRGA
jgi:hypothetical protein